MSGSREFGEIANELYGLRPDVFIEARDEQVARAKASGDKTLARQLGGLRRPTQSAWVVNALWRDRREGIEELLALAGEFNAAMAAGDGRRLQALTAQRREMEGELIQRARTLADEADVALNADMTREAQETLGAALVSPEIADEVRSGRLVRPLSYSGFGPGLPSSAAAVAPVRTRSTTTSRSRTAGKPRAARRDAQDDDRRAAAERELGDAREALAAAEEELAERTRDAERAESEYADLSDHLSELRHQVRELDQQVTAAKQAAARERRRRDQAEKAHDRARAAVERAERRLG